MNTFRAFLIKLIFVAVFTFSIYGIFHFASISKLLLMTLVVSGATFLGDLFILPRLNQAFAIFADFIGIFVLYLILGNIVIGGTTNIVLPALAGALFVGACEAFYHIYMMDQIHEEPRVGAQVGSLQVEIAEEINPEDLKELKEQNEKE